MRTVEAIIDESGKIELLEPIQLSAPFRALVIILEGEKPIADLRPFGLCQGEFTVPDDFDVPLPDEILATFESL